MAIPKREYSYQIILIPEAEGGYTVEVPLLPGCLSYGSTIEVAGLTTEKFLSPRN
jgi:predicted RNase H-like HicB family nuclease